MELNALIPLILTASAVLAVIALIAVLARNYIKVPPNKVAVFYGKSHKDAGGNTKGFRVVTGGSKFKMPIVEDVQYMDMASFQLKPSLRGIPNKDGVLVNVEAVATCKIKSDQTSLSAAVERFLGKTSEEIHRAVLEILEGQLRAVVGTMTVEELIQNREALNTAVKKEATAELDKLGIGIDILNIQSINDENKYIESLGKKRTAEVQRDATIGKAEADAEATKKSSTATKDAEVLKAQNDALTAEAQKERDVKKATYAAQVNAEEARAEQAGPLAQAEAEQKVVVQQVKIEEERERASIEVQRQRALVAAQAEEATRVVPARKSAEAAVATAEGEKKKTVITAEGARDAAVAKAEGDKKKQVLESEGSRDAQINAAQAEAQKRELEGKGEAAKVRLIAEARAFEAESVGLAEAKAIEAKLLAEARGIMEKAKAYKEMNEAAALQLILEKLPAILEKLPDIVAAAAQPMSAIDKVVMIGSDPNAPAKFAGNVPVFLAQLVETAKSAGFDLSGAFKKLGIDATGLTGTDTAETK